MRGRLASIGARESVLSEGWNLVLTEPGACAVPHDIHLSAQFIPAPVPGTVAAALEKAGLFDRENPEPLNTKDAWYLCRLFDAEPGEAILRFGGLATVCNVFLNGEEILFSESMFTAHELPVTLLGGDELALCFRALGPRLSEPGPRARWRPQMITPVGLKNFRTTLLGHMPGWCPDIHAVGPWRPISLVQRDTVSIDNVSIRAVLEENGVGRLSVSLHNNAEDPAMLLRCGGMEQPFEKVGENHYSAILKLSDIEPWWPHTHGTPRLYEMTLVSDGAEYSLGGTGFRRIDVDRAADGEDFALIVNGERIFCRGAVWTTADIARLPGGRADYEPFLGLASQAGMNMIRIAGTMLMRRPISLRSATSSACSCGRISCSPISTIRATTRLFSAMCMPRSRNSCTASRRHLPWRCFAAAAKSTSRRRCSACLWNSGAGRSPTRSFRPSPRACVPTCPMFQTRLMAERCRSRPIQASRIITASAPICGRLRRPPRRCAICLGMPCLCACAAAKDAAAPSRRPRRPQPAVEARVPRDRSASWDFEDVRDFYLELLYDFDPARLRREDLERYLDLSRAVTGEVIEESFAEWRRKGSGCNGALVWTLQDLLPGPGWGVIDSTGEPKPVWYAMRRAFRPIQAVFTDEGTNGLDVHVINETDSALDLELEVLCLRNGRQQVVSGNMGLKLAARSVERFACTALFGAFFDTTYAFRFGPPAHDASVARLRSLADGVVLAESFHFPCGRGKALHDATIEASLAKDGDDWVVDLRSDRLAQSVHIDVGGYWPDDDWFHLAPGALRRVRLHPLPGTESDAPPTGEIRNLGSSRRVGFAG